MWINADFLKYADNRGDVSIVIIIYFHYLKNLLRTARPEKAPQNSPRECGPYKGYPWYRWYKKELPLL